MFFSSLDNLCKFLPITSFTISLCFLNATFSSSISLFSGISTLKMDFHSRLTNLLSFNNLIASSALLVCDITIWVFFPFFESINFCKLSIALSLLPTSAISVRVIDKGFSSLIIFPVLSSYQSASSFILYFVFPVTISMLFAPNISL